MIAFTAHGYCKGEQIFGAQLAKGLEKPKASSKVKRQIFYAQFSLPSAPTKILMNGNGLSCGYLLRVPVRLHPVETESTPGSRNLRPTNALDIKW